MNSQSSPVSELGLPGAMRTVAVVAAKSANRASAAESAVGSWNRSSTFGDPWGRAAVSRQS